MSLSPSLVLVLAMLAFGKLLGHTRKLPESTPEVLNALVIWLLLPALVIRAVAGLEFRAELLVLVLTPWLLAAVTVMVVSGLGRLLHWPRPLIGCLLLCVSLGNTAFLGYPLIDAALGKAALPYAVVYDQLGSFLLLSTFGLAVVAWYGGGERPGALAMLRRIVLFPSFPALIFGLLPIAHPAWFDQMIGAMADMLVPLAIFAVGFQLRFVPARGTALPVAIGLTLKMLVMPLLAYALAAAVGVDRLIAVVNTLQAAMPTMITAGALAINARLAPEVATALVGYGVLLALVWIPLLGHVVA
jgi:predicted permease